MPLLGDHVVELEFSELDVGPMRVEQIVEAHERRLETDGSAVFDGRDEAEGDILVQRPDEQQVDSRKIEALLSDRSFDGTARRIATHGVDRLMRGALEMPLRCGSDRRRPIGRILPHRSVSIVPELVAVVPESLSEAIELGPGRVARRAR